MDETNVTLNFRKTLLLVASIVFLFLVPITTILILRENNKKQIWAPMIGQCPDYWKISKTKEGYVKCSTNENKNNAGSNNNINSFFTYQMPTTQNKFDFAIKNRIMWDGITNNAALVSKQRIEPDKTFGWLFGKMLAYNPSGSAFQHRATQDPNYLNEYGYSTSETASPDNPPPLF